MSDIATTAATTTAESDRMPLPPIAGTPLEQLKAIAIQLTTAAKALSFEHQWLDDTIDEARGELLAAISEGWADADDTGVYDVSVSAESIERHLANIASCGAIALEAAQTIRSILPCLPSDQTDGDDHA